MKKNHILLLVCVIVVIAACKKTPKESTTPVVNVPVTYRSANSPILATSTTSSLRSDGVMLVNGQPFFPLGYYGEGFNTLSQKTYLIDKLSDAGFNITYFEYESAGTQTSQFLDYCANKGVYTLANFYNMDRTVDPAITNFINTFKSKTSILLWGVADDANTFEPTDIRRKNNLVKSLDSRLTYQSFYDGGLKLDATVGEVDVSAMQSYPIFANGQMDRDWNKFVEIVNKCRTRGKTSIANLQVYRWGNNVPGDVTTFRWPTAAEVDIQSYLALVAGFKGVIFYTFKDYRPNPTSTVDITQKALWDQTRQFAGELTTPFTNAILNGSHSYAKQGDGIYYGKWVHNNEEYVVALNARSAANTVFIPVTGTKVTNLYGYRKATLAIGNGNLTGTLGGLEVQIYKVN